MFTEIKGQIERITFRSEETGYTVAKAKIAGRRDLVTVVGSFLTLSPGEVLKLNGEWERHPKFGEQFKVLSYESVVPATAAGIERYLGSGLIKGIGPVMAKRLVSKFGVDTLNVIERESGRLREVEGFGDKRIGMIRKAWDDQREIREVMLFLQSHGVSPAYGAKIFKYYGKDSVSVVRMNPYRLATDIFGIGFITADKIAEKLGIPKESPLRAEAGILYVLNQLSDEGHVYYPYEPLVEECMKVLGNERETILKAFGTAALAGKIVLEDLNREDVQENNKAVYLPAFRVSEMGIARRLHDLMRFPGKAFHGDRNGAIDWVQGMLRIELAVNQKQAQRMATEAKVMVITGGPGTGKTTLINAIIRIYRKAGQRVVLAAPTGRAAKRMSEATAEEAQNDTPPARVQPRRGEVQAGRGQPLGRRTWSSSTRRPMVDTILMHHLLKAVPSAPRWSSSATSISCRPWAPAMC
ncbi:MAG: ATP-dependent RecD-like DNA helicase [Comamonadaceae bacterium]|nr:ATP-dependent RecD-like DNA helicase [Comamonadaceae bacterium]